MLVRPQLFDVYWIRQLKSRKETDPEQPLDSSKDGRMYVIVGAHNGSTNVTACPVLTVRGQIRMTEVELKLKDYKSFLSNDSRVSCHEIFTIPISCLSPKKAGVISGTERVKIKFALMTYLNLL